MSDIRVEPVDERDSSWEHDRPRFRVYLHTSGPDDTRGGTYTYDITGADVLQAIDWAQRQAGEQLTYAVALVGEHHPGSAEVRRGLTWLVGMDGNDRARDDAEASTQRRMLQRRAAPVVIADADRMPPGVPDRPV